MIVPSRIDCVPLAKRIETTNSILEEYMWEYSPIVDTVAAMSDSLTLSRELYAAKNALIDSRQIFSSLDDK
jgi:hypothetical protein